MAYIDTKHLGKCETCRHQGYSNIEHDVDNFLRGYNEAVEDMLAILGERKVE